MKVGDFLKDIYARSYRVTRVIGEGGQGKVAEVVDGQALVYAAKTNHPAQATPEAEARLDALIRLDLSAHSKALCAPFVRLDSAHGVGAIQPIAPGEPLEKVFERPTYGLMDALTIGAALCRAVAVTEALGVCHGDLAATNVHVVSNGAFLETYLIDFDNAGVPGAPPPTFTGQEFYCSPELLLGTGKVSIESDRWALSVLLHEILLRRHPYSSFFQKGEPFTEYVKQLAQARWLDDPASGEARPATTGVPVAVLSRELHELFRRGLQTNPQLRPEAAEWAEKLETALSELYLCECCRKGFVNDVARYTCPSCGATAPGYEFQVNGRVIPLLGMVTIVGRNELGADESVSRRHLYFRRHGFVLKVTCLSPNGLAVYGDDQEWTLLKERESALISSGSRLQIAPGFEGAIRKT